jgi:translation elongation factor EF-1alpha
MSGLAGENLCERSKDPRLLSWYGEDSPCLIEVLDGLNLPARVYSKPIRASISEYCPKQQGSLIGDCVAVKVEAGVIKERDELIMMPHNVIVQIKGIEA